MKTGAPTGAGRRAEERPQRFSREAAAQVGTTAPTLTGLFDALMESVEVTALQRGVERWAG